MQTFDGVAMNELSAIPSAKIPVTALPKNNADRLAWLQLARSRRVGPVTFIRLLREYGSAVAALAALPEIAANAGARSYTPCDMDTAVQEYTSGLELGARLLCLGEKAYPQRLAMIDDPPPVLWYRGDLSIADRTTVALVGARNSSALGRRTAGIFAEELSELGIAVVSGLARGIDAVAHKSSLETGTIAVVAGGVDVIYPQENAALMQEIGEKGLLISEMPPGTTPQARHFPRRNRIISGLSKAVVVIEGAARSGSLITARNALDQGREVLAVPGHPFDARAAGCNMLIRDGATLVRSGKDVAAALSLETTQRIVPGSGLATDPKTTVPAEITDLLNYLSATPISEDQLIRDTGFPTPQLLQMLSLLDLNGLIERHPGGLVSRSA